MLPVKVSSALDGLLAYFAASGLFWIGSEYIQLDALMQTIIITLSGYGFGKAVMS
jgi:hypothetical protein